MEVLVFPLLALLIAVLIVWWTMFSGRPKDEPPKDESEPAGREEERNR